MKKGLILRISFVLVTVIILLMIGFSEFWLKNLSNAPNFFRDNAYIILPLILIAFTVGVLIWKMYYADSRNRSIETRFDPRNMKIGICLGSITSRGATILEKSEYRPFDDPRLISMLEYSGVCFLHGDIESLYGPFPMTGKHINESKNNLSQEEICYVSFGFQTTDNFYDPEGSGNFLPEGGVLGMFLLYYPKQLDSLILIRKKHIIDSFKSVINNTSNVSDSMSEKLDRLEKDIQFLSLF